jgi:hypothetical protein
MATARIEYPEPPPVVSWTLKVEQDLQRASSGFYKWKAVGKSLVTGAELSDGRGGYTSRASAADAAEEAARRITADHRRELDVKETWTLTL